MTAPPDKSLPLDAAAEGAKRGIRRWMAERNERGSKDVHPGLARAAAEGAVAAYLDAAATTSALSDEGRLREALEATSGFLHMFLHEGVPGGIGRRAYEETLDAVDALLADSAHSGPTEPAEPCCGDLFVSTTHCRDCPIVMAALSAREGPTEPAEGGASDMIQTPWGGIVERKHAAGPAET